MFYLNKMSSLLRRDEVSERIKSVATTLLQGFIVLIRVLFVTITLAVVAEILFTSVLESTYMNEKIDFNIKRCPDVRKTQYHFCDYSKMTSKVYLRELFDKYRIKSHQKYNVYLELKVPDDSRNYEAGMIEMDHSFIVYNTKTHPMISETPLYSKTVLFPYVSPVIRFMSSCMGAPLILLGLADQKSTFTIDMGSLLLKENEIPHGMEIELKTASINFYEARLVLKAELHGLSHIYNEFPILRQMFIATSFFILISFFHILAYFFVSMVNIDEIWSRICSSLSLDDDDDAPFTGTDAPSTGTDAPSTSTDAPSTGTDSPSTGTDSPSTGTDSPSTGTDSPSTDVVAPSTDVVAPSTDVVAPSTDVVAPSTDVVAPSTDAVAPSTDAVAPSTDAVAPSTDAVAPSTDTVAPSTDAVAPSTKIKFLLDEADSVSEYFVFTDKRETRDCRGARMEDIDISFNSDTDDSEIELLNSPNFKCKEELIDDRCSSPWESYVEEET